MPHNLRNRRSAGGQRVRLDPGLDDGACAEHGHPGGIAMTERYVLGLEEIDKTQVTLVGGKGAQLGELSRIEGIRVPAGFCVTTHAFRRITSTEPWPDGQDDRVLLLGPRDRPA